MFHAIAIGFGLVIGAALAIMFLFKFKSIMKFIGYTLLAIIIGVALLIWDANDPESFKGIMALVGAIVMIFGIMLWAYILVNSPGGKLWGRRIVHGWRRILHS